MSVLRKSSKLDAFKADMLLELLDEASQTVHNATILSEEEEPDND